MSDVDNKKAPLAQFQKLLAAILSVPKPELDKALAEEAAEKQEPIAEELETKEQVEE